jgi:hypothetical protein
MGRSEHFQRLSLCAQRAALWTGTCLLAALTSGCAGTVHPAGNAVTQTPGAQTFGISGAVSPTMGGSGTVLTLSGSASATATADNTGAYSFSGLSAGT